jgi:hypothetical protein
LKKNSPSCKQGHKPQWDVMSSVFSPVLCYSLPSTEQKEKFGLAAR